MLRLFFVTICVACASETPASHQASADLPNGRRVDGMLVGGRPSVAQLEAAQRAGFRTVISLQTAREPGANTSKVETSRLGMAHVSIPVAGAKGLTRENVARLDEAIVGAKGLVVLHCASGNRAGAMLALRARWHGNKSVAAAIAYGVEAGMTSLRGAVEERLHE